MASIDDIINSVLADLRRRNIVDVVQSSTTITIADEQLVPLGHIVANAARSEFGATNGTELFTLAQKAEIDLEAMQKGKTAL